MNDLNSKSSMGSLLDNQMRRRTKKGYQLTLMVCGRAGTGKSTFVNTLCDGELLDVDSLRRCSPTTNLEIREHKVDLTEKDGKVINLTVIDTPGFGDRIDNSGEAQKILQYLEAQFGSVLLEEARIRRNPRFEDTRVHVCLYFLPPTGHGLRELDIDLMTTLSSRVNVIPVVAKADTMGDEELGEFKRRVMADIEMNEIPVFQFMTDPDDDPLTLERTMHLRQTVPFAVVGSNLIYSVGDEYVRGREYPWGFVRAEDPEHSDFSTLRYVLFESHIQELRDLTQEVIYERYRTERLCKEPDLLSPKRDQMSLISMEAGSMSGTLGPMSLATPNYSDAVH